LLGIHTHKGRRGNNNFSHVTVTWEDSVNVSQNKKSTPSKLRLRASGVGRRENKRKVERFGLLAETRPKRSFPSKTPASKKRKSNNPPQGIFGEIALISVANYHMLC